MFIRLLILILSFAPLSSFAAANEPASTVTIPIKEYLDLKKQTEKDSLTTLEEVHLSGEYEKHIEIVFSGASAGKPEPIPVLQESPGLSLSNCSGQAMLRAESGTIQLLPLAPRFKLQCQVSVKSWQSFSLTLLNALFLKMDIKGADPTISADSISRRQITFHRAEVKRVMAEAPTNEEPSFVARYQISVLPEETKFHYFLTVNNPNRSPKTFELAWPNKEIVSDLQTSNTYEEGKNGPIFKLAPGTSQIRIRGRLPQPEFMPLLGGKSVEYLMIDNHPLLTVEIKGGARRVNVKDAGMSPAFASSRSYLIGKNDHYTWQAKQLEVFPSLPYAVTSADYHYYASAQSAPLVEAYFQIDNQGSPEIPFKIPGHATYLEINGVPQVLTKDQDSQLLIRLPTGTNQSVLVQYQTQNESPSRTLASVGEELARPPSLMSNVSVSLQVPGQRNYIFASALDDFHAGVTWFQVLVGFLIFSLYFFLLRRMQWHPLTLWTASLCMTALVLIRGPWALWAFALGLACLLVHSRRWLMGLRVPGWRGWVLMAFGILVMAVVVPNAMNLFSPSYRVSQSLSETQTGFAQNAFSPAAPAALMKDRARMEGKSSHRASADSAAAPMAAGVSGSAQGMEEDELSAVATEAPVSSMVANEAEAESYQGLPARIHMPTDGYELHFHSGMIDREGLVRLHFLTVGHWVPMGLTFLLLTLLGLACWRERSRLREYLR